MFYEDDGDGQAESRKAALTRIFTEVADGTKKTPSQFVSKLYSKLFTRELRVQLVWGSKRDHHSKDRDAKHMPDGFKQHIQWFIDNLNHVEYPWYNKVEVQRLLSHHFVSLASRSRKKPGEVLHKDDNDSDTFMQTGKHFLCG